MNMPLSRIARGIRNTLNRHAYRRFRSRPIDPHAVLLDQQHGLTADGNLHYIAFELADGERYGELSLHFATDRRNHDRMCDLISRRGLPVTPVVRSSRRYYELLATCKWLVADTSLPPAFEKRDGQTYWNTWHGTPLKTLGRAERAEAHLIGNVQKNLATADYLSFPNEFTARRTVDDYEIARLGQPTLLFGEYPRNEAFARSAELTERDRLIPTGKRAYAYLPTFRFSPQDGTKTASIDQIEQYLVEIDGLLHEDEILFARLHPAIGRSIDLAPLAHIDPFPDDIEAYRFLNLCDALVTDYSSVMFDFAITRRKVVLFTFDKEEYLATRGLYLKLNELPFPQVKSTQGVIDELRAPREYDDRAFLARFAPYSAEQATEKLCRRVFNSEGGLVEEASLGDFTGEKPL